METARDFTDAADSMVQQVWANLAAIDDLAARGQEILAECEALPWWRLARRQRMTSQAAGIAGQITGLKLENDQLLLRSGLLLALERLR